MPRDALGLMLDDSDILTTPPSVIVYGQAGGGKTTDVAKAFNNSLYVCSNGTILRPFESWCRDNEDEVKEKGIRTCTKPNPNFDPKEEESEKNPRRLPRSWDEGGMARKTIPTEGPDGKPVKTEATLLEILKRFADSCAKKECPYNGIVFDEWSTFSHRVYAEMQKKHGKTWGTIDKIKEFHATLHEIPARTGRPLTLVCHDQEPKYHEEGPSAGMLKYKGGPRLPIGTIIGDICAQFDIVLHLVVAGSELGETGRHYATVAHDKWERKFRDFGIQPEEELGLRDLMLRAGYLI